MQVIGDDWPPNGPRNLIFCESTEPIAIIGSFYVPKERAAISAGDVQGDGGCFPNEQNLALYYKDTARTVTDEQEHSLLSIIYPDYSPDSMDSC